MEYLHILKVSPHKTLINYEEKLYNFRVENLADTTITKWSKLTQH